MNEILYGFALVITYLGRFLVALAIFLAVVALVDWLVRTRRINPFNPLARFFRRSVDPLMAPVERRIVAAGGLPSHAPWWSLVIVVVGGILVLSALRFVHAQLVELEIALGGGIGGMYRFLVRTTFGVLTLALIVRIVASWFRVSPWSPWVRWSFVLSEPILRPLRQVVPMLGMFDVTPIIAYILLQILEGVFLSLGR